MTRAGTERSTDLRQTCLRSSRHADAPVIQFGHSVSATIGMLAAIRDPEMFAANVFDGADHGTVASPGVRGKPGIWG